MSYGRIRDLGVDVKGRDKGKHKKVVNKHTHPVDHEGNKVSFNL